MKMTMILIVDGQETKLVKGKADSACMMMQERQGCGGFSGNEVLTWTE
jgi:hypothetical protein